MKISIIVPIYNVESYLAKCLDSLINQKYSDYEIICVNDGSTDQSLRILETYQNKSSKIRILNKPNGGLSDARNYGVAHCEGDYVLFVDGDDYVSNQYLEKMIHPVLDDVNVEVVVCDMEYVYSNHSTLSSGGNFKKCNFKSNPKLLEINNSACNKLIKLSLVKSNPFIVGMWYEDLATIPIMMMNAKLVDKVDEPLYFYVQREGSIVHTENIKIFDIYKALEIIVKSVPNPSREIIRIINYLYMMHGADITTQKIRYYSNHRIEFLKKNQEYMKKYNSIWIFNRNIFKFNIKKIVLLFLFYFGSHRFLLKLLDAKG